MDINSVFDSNYLSLETNDYEFRLPCQSKDFCEFGFREFVGFGALSSNLIIDGADGLENYLLNSNQQPNHPSFSVIDKARKAKFMIKSMAHSKISESSDKENEKSSIGLKDDDITEIDSRLNEVNKLLQQKRASNPNSKNANSALSKMVKEQLKMEKNRLSAKKSREKQKRKMEDLESINEQLVKENEKLLEETQKCNHILALVQNYCSKSMCKSCSRNLPSEFKNYAIIDDNQSTDEMESSLFVTSESNSTSHESARISLIAAIILIAICVINSLSKDTKVVTINTSPTNQGRLLSEEKYSSLPNYSMVIDYQSNFNESIKAAYINRLE